MAAWAAVGTIYVKGVRSQQLDRIAAECSNEAVRIAGELDGRMVKIRNLLENVSNIPWIKKLSTSSEIFLRDFTVLERMECTSELARLSYAEPSIVHTALYIRTQNRVLSPKGWFTVEEYRASIRDLPGVELDEILRLAEEKHSFDSFPNLPYNIDAGNHIVIIHSMADVAHPLASLIVILDRQRFGEDVERLSSSRIERVEIVTDAGQVLLTVKKTASTAGEDGTSPVSINSEVVGVRYEITYPPLEEMAGEYGAIGLSAVLKLLAGSLLAVLVSYLISLFIIRPVKRLVRRISALLDNGESSSVMKLEQIEESFFRLCEKERTLQRDLRQVSNAARKYILLLLLYGGDAEEIEEKQALTAFHIPFTEEGEYSVWRLYMGRETGDRESLERSLQAFSFPGLLAVETVCLTEDQLVCIACWDREAAPETDTLAKALTGGLCHREPAAEFQNGLQIGGSYPGLKGIARSFQEITGQSSLRVRKTPSTRQLEREMLQYVCDHFCEEDMSLKRLSSQFHLSVSAISNIFKAVNGINFSDYLISLRMAKAKRLFFEMGYAPAEIGRLVGYASEYSFRRAFSRNEGCRLQEWCAKNHITGSR